MSRSRLLVDAHAGMIMALVLVGAAAAWEARVSRVVEMCLEVI